MSTGRPARSRSFDEPERLSVSLELTNACNFRCPICPQATRHAERLPGSRPYNRATGFISRAVFERAVGECQRVARRVELGFFGEQTLHPAFIPFMRALENRVFGLEVNTNVSLLTREIMRVWIDVRLDVARLSVDAITPDIFNRARPGLVRDFAGRPVPEERRLAVINEKIEHWLALPAHRPTRLVFVESAYNRGELIPFLEQWLPKLGSSDSVLAKRVLSYGGKISDPLVEPHDCNIWEQRYLVIDWRGDVSPCNLDTNMDLVLGNVMEHSIEQLYFGPKAQALRRQTGCGRDVTPCRTCIDGNNWSYNQTFRRGDRLPTEADLATPVSLRPSAVAAPTGCRRPG
jgi:radical SAM protein with 4Fe4S-binding SPASM domain